MAMGGSHDGDRHHRSSTAPVGLTRSCEDISTVENMHVVERLHREREHPQWTATVEGIQTCHLSLSLGKLTHALAL